MKHWKGHCSDVWAELMSVNMFSLFYNCSPSQPMKAPHKLSLWRPLCKMTSKWSLLAANIATVHPSDQGQYVTYFLSLSSVLFRGSFKFLWSLSNECNWVIKLYTWKQSKQKPPLGCNVGSQVFCKSVKQLSSALLHAETPWTTYNNSKNLTTSLTQSFI